MLDPRIYRAGLIPLAFVLIVAAFSLRDRPRPVTASLAPDAFDAARAMAELDALAKAAPERRPGSAGDERLATRVAGSLRRDRAGRNGRFVVTERHRMARTIDGRRDLVTVIARRDGLSPRQIAVVAHRDSAFAPARADLSGTAALLELARVFGGRQLRKTLVLASTSGASGGDGGVREVVRALRRPGAGPVDAVIVLGDVGGTEVRKPLVPAWAPGNGAAPLRLRRTVESALRTEAATEAGGPRLLAQIARLALPVTAGEQGRFGSSGLPAVLIGATGEHGPGGSDAVDEDRLQAFGRAALRTVSAVDDDPDFGQPPTRYLVVQRKVAPAWTMRLLVLALLLPVLLVAIDGAARLRRRGVPLAMWVRWALAGAIVPAGALLFVRFLGLVGLVPGAVPTMPPPGAVDVGARAVLAVVAVGLVLVLLWIALRPLALRLGEVRGDAGSTGAGAGALGLACVAIVGLWLSNPFAALLLVPALHLWLAVAAPEVRLGRPAAVAAATAGLLPVLLAGAYVVAGLHYGPAESLWIAVLLLAGGGPGPATVVLWSIVLGCAASFVVIAVRGSTGPPEEPDVTVRGPLTYAGPGSLGGTDSALRG